MELLVIRHGVAEDRLTFAAEGRPDADRPLSPAGRRKLERSVHGLRRMVPSIDLLATSALVRAQQTAAIVQEVYRIRRVTSLRELEPDAPPSALVQWLRRQRRRPVVAVVGHEPHLSRTIELLLAGSPSGFVELKKGGACLLDLGDDPEAETARLRWLATGAQLRRLRR